MIREHVSPKQVLGTGGALLALWALSFALSFVSFSPTVSTAIALLIAVAKASLVALFFMELAHERTSVRLTFVAALTLALVLIGLVVTDISTRDRAPLEVPGASSP